MRNRQYYRESVRWAKKVEMPEFYWTHHVLAVGYAQLNMPDAASDAVASLLKAYPDFAQNAWSELRKSFWEEEVVAHHAEGLRKAGLDIPPDPGANRM